MRYTEKFLSSKLLFSFTLLILFCSAKLIAQPLVADGGLSQTICNGSSTTIGGSPTANYGAGGYSYSWAPAGGLSATNVSNPVANPSSTVTYTITVTDVALAVATSTVTVTVNPVPSVNPTLTPIACAGSTISGITFFSTPGGATFTWTNSNPSIGLAASGVGNMPSFLATNSGSTTIGGNVSVTATLAGCVSAPYVFSPTVKPKPVGTTTPTSQTVCSGVASNFVSTSTVAGTTYTWAAFGSGVTGHSGGSGSLIAQTVSTTSAATGGVTYTITPTAAGCVGTNMIVNLTVKPNPVATATTSPLTRCSGDTVSFSVSCPVPSTTYTWTSFATNTSGADASGTGSFVFDTLIATTTSAGTMVYIFTPTAAGCVGTQAFPFVNVNPAPDATFSYSSSGCQFTPNALPSFPPGASAGTFTSTPIGMNINSITGEIDLSTSTPGSYLVTNTIAAAGGCPSVNVNNGFTITAYLNPTITPVAPICFSAPMFNLNAASSGGTWSGSGIINASTGLFDPSNAGVGTFTITYTTPAPCLDVDTVLLSVIYTDIHGKVTYSGGTMTNGTSTAVLFNYISGVYTSYDTIRVSPVDTSGYYHFTAVPQGQYLIEVFADTTLYPLAVPTYYDSEYLWDTAMVKNHSCSIDTADVYVIEGIVTTGPGSISGFVTEGAGFVRTPGDPIPGLDVKLGKNPGGAMVTNTQTSSPAGAYTFTNLPLNSAGEYYTVYVDVPGLLRDSVYNITITASNTTFTNMNYLADSNSVYPFYPVVTGMLSAELANSFTVFPNPTTTAATVDYTLDAAGKVHLDVYDILGKRVQRLVSVPQPAGRHQVELKDLNAGIYFIKLTINNQTNTIRLVVTD